MFSLLTSTRRLNDRYKNIRKNQSAIYVISLDINYILFCKSAIVFNISLIYNTKKFLEEWNPQIISQVLRNPLVVIMKYMFPNIS